MASKKTTKKNVKKKDSLPMGNEVTVIASIGVMILMLLSNFNLCGAIGVGLSSVFFGIFGCIQYIMPVAVCGALMFLIANDYSALSVKKCSAFFILLLIVSAFAGLFYKGKAEFSDLFTLGINNHATGGILGGGFAKILENGFGKAGAVVILLCCALLALVLLTQKSFVGFFKDSSDRLKKYWGEQKERMATEKEEEEKPKKKNSMGRIKNKKVEEKVRQIQESMEEKRTKKSRVKQENGKEMNIPLFTSSEEVKKTDSMKELHPELYPISPEEGKMPPLKQELDFSAFSYQQDRQDELDYLTSLPEFAKTMEELTARSEASIPPNKSKGGFHEEFNETEMPVEEENTIEAELTEETEKIIAHKPREEQKEEIQIHRAGPEKPAGKVIQAEGGDYVFPPMSLLTSSNQDVPEDFDEMLKETALKLQETLASFGVFVTITDISCGPAVTRYEFFPEQGTKVSKILSLTDDIKLNLAAQDVRIEAPIPGKAAIGIEIPNKTVQIVHFRETIDNRTFRKNRSKLAVVIGKDIGGKIIVTDLAKMPHLLIAGATGSGKSVCINTLIMSILYKARPDEVKLIMVDPKMVELSMYNGIPHLLIPVVTDPKKASGALNWAVAEMTERYKKFAEAGVRNIEGYNRKINELLKKDDMDPEKLEKMPKIVIIIDELADLMMVAPGEVEDAIVRLSQLARAAGIHLVIATQRPSVNVITGLIKANIPSRIALSVSSGVDSRTIIDMYGAEKLLGNGDMLFFPAGYQKPVRVQGAYITDEEINNVVEFLKDNEKVIVYDDEVTEQIEKKITVTQSAQDRDEYFEAAARFIMEKDKATIGMLQRMFKIGFNRAARIMDQLADAGIVGPEEGTKPRKILMTPEELDTFLSEQ